MTQQIVYLGYLKSPWVLTYFSRRRSLIQWWYFHTVPNSFISTFQVVCSPINSHKTTIWKFNNVYNVFWSANMQKHTRFTRKVSCVLTICRPVQTTLRSAFIQRICKRFIQTFVNNLSKLLNSNSLLKHGKPNCFSRPLAGFYGHYNMFPQLFCLKCCGYLSDWTQTDWPTDNLIMFARITVLSTWSIDTYVIFYHVLMSSMTTGKKWYQDKTSVLSVI